MGQYFHATCLEKLKSVNTFDLGDAVASLKNGADKYEYSSGQKLMEHSWIGNHYVKFIMLLLSDSYKMGYNLVKGPWYNMPFGWVGDYSGGKEDGVDERPSLNEILSHVDELLKQYLIEDINQSDEPDTSSRIKSLIEDLYREQIGYYNMSSDYTVSELIQIIKDNAINSDLALPEFRYIINTTKKLIIDLNIVINNYKLNEKTEDDWMIHPLPLLTCAGNGRGGGDFRSEDSRVGTWFKDRIYTSNKLPEDKSYTILNDAEFYEV